ncbi:MAG: magnesium transporter [Lachnospiraceae bacterium]|nr:magnesium transporter [Lachnospiraceae bacterium]
MSLENLEEIEELIENKEFRKIKSELEDENVVDIAEFLSELENKYLAVIFRLLPKKKAAEVFSYMEKDQQMVLLDLFSDKEMKDVMDSMFADDMVDLLEDMPANVVTRVLGKVDKETREAVNKMLKYPDDSAGSIMTIEFVELAPDMTVAQALDKIRQVGIKSETVYSCYVVKNHELLGVVSAKDLMTNPVETPIADLMNENIISVHTTDDREEVANLFRKYDLIALPVLDVEDYMVGIVTVDDAIDVLTTETTEDMQKMAAMTVSEESYFDTSVFQHAKNRIVWLLILMLSSTFTGMIITKYENAFAAVPLLVSFIPMLMDTGGNCGSQSSTLIIRGLAIDEIHFNDIFKIVWKEFRVSMLVSLALALANGVRVYIMYHDLSMAVVVAFSLVFTVVVAKLIGCMLPVFAKMIRLDPAIMAAPLITTIVDLCSIMIYFKIATMVFKL